MPALALHRPPGPCFGKSTPGSQVLVAESACAVEIEEESAVDPTTVTALAATAAVVAGAAVVAIARDSVSDNWAVASIVSDTAECVSDNWAVASIVSDTAEWAGPVANLIADACPTSSFAPREANAA